jgi:hypothetical protein
MSDLPSLPQTEQEFISDVKSELTVACAMPIAPKDVEIRRIIKYAAKWFYRNFEDAVEERYYAIPVSVFQTESFRRTRVIQFPECVLSVIGLKKLRENLSLSYSFDGTRDLGLERILLQNLDSSGVSTEPVMYYAVSLYWTDTLSHLLNHTISYNYNRNSNKLFVAGETPDRDCVATCYVTQPLEHLMKSEVFYRYVVATAKMQMARVIGTIDMQLPGNAKINYEMLKEEGKDALQEIREEIRKEEGMDFFFTTGGS